MKGRLLNAVLLLQPLLLIGCYFSPLDWVWSLSADARYYDLVLACLSLGLFWWGMRRATVLHWLSLFTLFAMPFIAYQLFSWSFKGHQPLAQLPLDAGQVLVLESIDGGAFTTTTHTKVLLSSRCGGLFRCTRALAGLPGGHSAELSRDGQAVSIRLVPYEGEAITKTLTLP